GKKAMYVGGTTEIPEKTKGSLDLDQQDSAQFLSEKGALLLAVPYQNITGMEYGQQAGRRLGLAIAVNPLFLFSKKRKHYLTVYFSDQNGETQAAVFELAKGVVHEVVTTLETRSGQKVEFESEEARKHYEKEAN
ncbi:MAG: hypothetical protein L0338_27840, partial [Acidobacteria bacterium]|nr:hypothetical protein [Acidobacteriota bacterium]